jgi:hypothetical protein
MQRVLFFIKEKVIDRYSVFTVGREVIILADTAVSLNRIQLNKLSLSSF